MRAAPGFQQSGTGRYTDSRQMIVRIVAGVEAVFPDAITTLFGRNLAGDEDSVTDDDDEYYFVEQRARVSPLLPFIRIRLEGRTSFPLPTEVSILLQSRCDAIPTQPEERLRAVRPDGTSVAVSSRIATLDDTDVEVQLSDFGDPAEFVSASGDLAAVLEYWDPGQVFSPNWGGYLDLFLWTVED